MDTIPIQQPTRVDVLGVPIDCLDMQATITLVEELLAGDSTSAIIAVNPEKVMKARQDPILLKQIASAGVLIPDGIGVVLAARLLRGCSLMRVPGSELMPEICALAATHEYKVFLYGAAAEVIEQALATLRHRYPTLQIAGYQDGYLDEEEMPSLIDRINASGADILFVALGSPRQELWMSKYLSSLNVRICQGVGGTFDVIAGKVRRAPRIICVLQLEWLYRLAMSPGRLLRQTALPVFAGLVLRDLVEQQKKKLA